MINAISRLVKGWLILNLSLALVAVAARPAVAPRGAWFTVIKVEKDDGIEGYNSQWGTDISVVLRWQEVSG